MTAIESFPLLGLPDKEILRTIRVMDLHEILKFSTISERCKNLVSSIKIKGASFSVWIGSCIEIRIRIGLIKMEFQFYTEPDLYWEAEAYGRKKKLTTPQSVQIKVYKNNSWINLSFIEANRNYSMMDWLKHLQDVFNCDKIDLIVFARNSSEFDIDDVKEVFGKPTELGIRDTRCDVFNELILQNYSPADKLYTDTFNFRNPKSILLQNFLDLHLGRIGRFAPITLKLEDLLMINSKSIWFGNLQMSPNAFNKFIKLWQKGSNPHMEHLWAYYQNSKEHDDKIIMKGIKHEVIPPEKERKFKTSGSERPVLVRGGMDIYRKDGTKATIEIKFCRHFSYWRMFVWMDHCIVF